MTWKKVLIAWAMCSFINFFGTPYCLCKAFHLWLNKIFPMYNLICLFFLYVWSSIFQGLNQKSLKLYLAGHLYVASWQSVK